MGCGSSITDFFEDAWDVVEDVAESTWDVVEDVAEVVWETGEVLLEGIWDFTSAVLFDWWMPEMPEIPDQGGSPTMANDKPINTVREGIPIPLVFGRCLVGGNLLRVNSQEEADRKYIIAYSKGEISGVEKRKLNDIEWADLEGSPTYTDYTGTRSQTADSRFSDKAQAYRGIAYTAYTIPEASQIRGIPHFLHLVNGIKCPTLANPGVKAFTRNPAVILAYIYTELEGYDWNDLDIAEFQALEAYCDTIPSGGTIPRYRFDYAFDTKMSLDDMKRIIFKSFHGWVILSQGKLKPVWETARDSVYDFTLDNIVQGSFKDWGEPEDRPNVIRIYYRDSEKNFKKTSVELRNEDNIAVNGEILYEESCWWITDREIAKRRCQFKHDKIKYTDAVCTLTGMYDSAKLEVYDRVTVTHPLAGWTAKDFIVRSKRQDQNGLCTFVLEAYYEGIYHDRQAAVQENYASTLPNPYQPRPVTDVSLVEGGEISGAGIYVPYLTLNFTKPADAVFWDHVEVYLSTDDNEYTYYGDAKDTGYKIEAISGGFKEGDTVYVKLVSVNRQTGAKQDMPASADASIYVMGKAIPPSDVTNFRGTQNGNAIEFRWDPLPRSTDADVAGFIIKSGVSYGAGIEIINTTQGNSATWYPPIDGTYRFWIKAIDISGNLSETAAECQVNVSGINDSINIIFDQNELTKSTPADGTRENIIFIAETPALAVPHSLNDTDIPTWTDLSPEITDYDGSVNLTGSYISTPLDCGQVGDTTIRIKTSFESIDTYVTDQSYPDRTDRTYPKDTDINITAETEFKVYYSVSNDNIDWSDWVEYFSLAMLLFQYVKIKLAFTLTSATARLIIDEAYFSADVPDVIKDLLNQAIGVGGKYYSFSDLGITIRQQFTVSPTILNDANRFPVITKNNLLGFTCTVYDSASADVGGTVDLKIRGY